MRPRERQGYPTCRARSAWLGEYPGVVGDHRHLGARALDAEHRDLGAADHEVRVDDGVVVAAGGELIVAQLLAAVERALDPLAPRDVAGGVLVEERVVEDDAGLADT